MGRLKRRRAIGIAAALLLCGFGLLIAPAAAEPEKDHWLTAKDGPFLIYVSSFRGDDAYMMARDLVNELRQPPYKLDAFLYKRVDEEAQALKQQMIEMQKQKMNLQEGDKTVRVRVLEEFGVLIGSYRSMDAARADLKDRIKKQPKPKSVKDYGLIWWGKKPWDEKPSRASSGIEQFTIRPSEEDKVVERRENPFTNAFVIRNPLLPRPANPSGANQRKNEAETDPYESLNLNDKFSIYKCAKPYSLVVKQYDVIPEIDTSKPSVFDKLRGANPLARSGGKLKGPELAISQAHQLAELLHDNGKGLEVYVLHSEYASLVMVGGFQDKNDPALKAAQQQLGGLAVGGTRLLHAPMAYQVPRRSGLLSSAGSQR